MIVHLVKNNQLKKPIKGVGPLSPILVQMDGTVIAPMAVRVASSHVKSGPLTSFDIVDHVATTMVATAKVFSTLLTHLPDVDKVAIRQLCTSQALTIALVTKQLNIPRSSAKDFIERCVRCGAYKKYYSYWIQTDIFSSWMAHQDGGGI